MQRGGRAAGAAAQPGGAHRWALRAWGPVRRRPRGARLLADQHDTHPAARPAVSARTRAGALVSGPAADGSFADDRTASAQSSVGVHHNVPLIGLLGGLLASGVTQGQCAAGHGLYQLYAVKGLP